MTDRIIRAPFRMALRHEGEFWNAYYAKADTMEGALLIASIRMTLVADENSRRQWQKTMSDIFQRMVESKGLTVDHMIHEGAPEHERSGHA